MRRAPAMQWVCASGVLAAAQSAAQTFAREHGLAVELRHLADGAALLHASVDCETQWRRGQRPRVDSPLERWIAIAPGPVLCITDGERAQAEALRAFVPAGHAYLGLWGDDAHQPEAIAQAAWQLVQAGAGRWLTLAVD
jgi:pyruvate dehydrogenase complex dehydrogenase (E1) component